MKPERRDEIAEPVTPTEIEIVTPDRHSNTPARPEVDYHVSGDTRKLVERATSANRERAYHEDVVTYMDFCAATGRTPVPATPETLAEFVRHLARTPGKRVTWRSPATIERALSHVRTLHHDRLGRRLDDREVKPAQKVLAGYRKERADKGVSNRTRAAMPILAVDLQAMLGACLKPPYDISPIGVRNRLLLLLGWMMAGRRSELHGLNLGDVRVVRTIRDGLPEVGVEVWISHSKTDQDARGQAVFLPSKGAPPGCDPVAAVEDWVSWIHAQGQEGEPALFRPVKWGRIEPRRLSEHSINKMVSDCAAKARYEDGSSLPHAADITAHSLRAGWATQAYLSGVPLARIIEHGRWSTKSTSVYNYIRSADHWRNDVMKQVWEGGA